MLGEKFRMSIKEECKKTIDNTTNEWVENYKGIQGLNGRLFTAKNGNTLFFPAAGYYDYSDFCSAGSHGYLRSASLYSYYPSCAYLLSFGSDYIYPDDYGSNRYSGFTVRGIQNPL